MTISMILSCSDGQLHQERVIGSAGQEAAWQQAEVAMEAAMQSIGAKHGALVLHHYRCYTQFVQHVFVQHLLQHLSLFPKMICLCSKTRLPGKVCLIAVRFYRYVSLGAAFVLACMQGLPSRSRASCTFRLCWLQVLTHKAWSTCIGSCASLCKTCRNLFSTCSLCAMCRYMTTDEQLYKDLEGVLEQSFDMFKWRHQQSKQPLTQTQQLMSVLELWDGICHLYTGKTKPGHWISQLLKALKLFTPEARRQAANHAEISSDLMGKAKCSWLELKAPKIRALFEIADVTDANGATNKRQRRTGTVRLEQ